MQSNTTHHAQSDNNFLSDLKRNDMMNVYPNDPEKQAISLQIEQQFRRGFLEAASEAVSLVVDPTNAYGDIYEHLGLNEALRMQNIIRRSINNKKLRHLELAAFYKDGHGSLDLDHDNVIKLIQYAKRMAYWRGQVHALSDIDQAMHHPELADVFCNRWDYFHETLIKPWAEEVKRWADNLIEQADNGLYNCPPDLITMAIEKAANIRVIHA